MDIDPYNHVETGLNGAASNPDRYLTPVEYHVTSRSTLIELVNMPASA
jgi:hypothetical protein